MVAVAGAAAGQATAVLPPEPANVVPPVPPVALVPPVLATVPPVLATVPPVLSTVPPVPRLTVVPPVADRRLRHESRSELDGSTDPEAPAVPSVAASTDPTSPLQATAPHTMDSPRTKEMPLIIRGAQLLFPKEALERDGATARTQ